jgi:hypothetical protein
MWRWAARLLEMQQLAMRLVVLQLAMQQCVVR